MDEFFSKIQRSYISKLTLIIQVSAWGGYVFIINLIPLHVFVLLLMQRFSRRVYVGKVVSTSVLDSEAA